MTEIDFISISYIYLLMFKLLLLLTVSAVVVNHVCMCAFVLCV